MWKASLKQFLPYLFGGVYSKILIVFVGSIGLFDRYINPILPQIYQFNLKVSGSVIIVVLLLILLWNSFRAFNKLRTSMLHEFYRVSPEANSDRVFRIFFSHYKYGEFLKKANTARRQKWDEDLVRDMTSYFNHTSRDVYLLNTGRHWGHTLDPLLDDKYDRAVELIKDIVYDDDFSRYLRA